MKDTIELTQVVDSRRDMAELERLERIASMQDSACRLDALVGVALGIALVLFFYNVL